MSGSKYKQALPQGAILNGYRLLEVLGVGGFGITYLGERVGHGRLAAIKEYLPNEFAIRDGSSVCPKSTADQEGFDWGLGRFEDEAETLAHFRHPNLVRVESYFRDNNTAYIVMQYEDGKPLDNLLSRLGTLSEKLLKPLLLPLADGLRQVHAEGFLHRDIKPANVYVRREDETPVLLDFGAARHALGRRSGTMAAVVTPGYSPPEQYDSGGDQGPWTDLYALSALCYRAITGSVPAVSLRRQNLVARNQPDPMPSLEASRLAGFSASFLAAIDWGLRTDERERPQSVDEWLAAMNQSRGYNAATAPPTVAPVAAAPTQALRRSHRIRIGRGRDMDVVVDSKSVSRQHAELVISGLDDTRNARRYQVMDCKSTNGTRVYRGGRWQRVQKAFLQPQDALRLGSYETTPAALEAIAMQSVQEVKRKEPRAVGIRPPPREIDACDLPAGVQVRRDPRSGEVVGE